MYQYQANFGAVSYARNKILILLLLQLSPNTNNISTYMSFTDVLLDSKSFIPTCMATASWLFT